MIIIDIDRYKKKHNIITLLAISPSPALERFRCQQCRRFVEVQKRESISSSICKIIWYHLGIQHSFDLFASLGSDPVVPGPDSTAAESEPADPESERPSASEDPHSAGKNTVLDNNNHYLSHFEITYLKMIQIYFQVAYILYIIFSFYFVILMVSLHICQN